MSGKRKKTSATENLAEQSLDVERDAEGATPEEASAATDKSVDSEARRKLEEALEERRLQKEIQDYDFDL